MLALSCSPSGHVGLPGQRHGLGALIGGLRPLLCTNACEMSDANYILRCTVMWRAWHGRRRRVDDEGAHDKWSVAKQVSALLMLPWRFGEEHDAGRAAKRRPMLHADVENICAGGAQAGLRTHRRRWTASGCLRASPCVWLVGRSVCWGARFFRYSFLLASTKCKCVK